MLEFSAGEIRKISKAEVRCSFTISLTQWSVLGRMKISDAPGNSGASDCRASRQTDDIGLSLGFPIRTQDTMLP